MDYYPLNVPTAGIDNVHVASPKIGDYDKLTIAYGYRELSAPWPVVNGPPTELLSLLEEAGTFDVCSDDEFSLAQDPLCEQHEMGSDPLQYYRAVLEQSRSIQSLSPNVSVAPGEPYWNYEETVEYALGEAVRVAESLIYWIGGSNTRHSHRPAAGGDHADGPTAPVPEARQREALGLILQALRPYSSGLLPPRDFRSFLVTQVDDWPDTVARLDLDKIVQDIQASGIEALLDETKLNTLAEGEAFGGMRVSTLLADVASAVLGGPSGAGVAESQDWDLQALVAQALRRLELSTDVPEGVAANVAVSASEMRSRLTHGLGELAAVAEEAWSQCSAEGGACECDGDVRYGVAREQVWAPVRASSDRVNCSNAVFGDPKPYSDKVCECFPRSVSADAARDRVLREHLRRLLEALG